jgi:hypothetical protein
MDYPPVPPGRRTTSSCGLILQMLRLPPPLHIWNLLLHLLNVLVHPLRYALHLLQQKYLAILDLLHLSPSMLQGHNVVYNGARCYEGCDGFME